MLAPLAVAAVRVPAALFGQTARTSSARRGSPSRRSGMVLSMTGPWPAVLLAVAGGALTGE